MASRDKKKLPFESEDALLFAPSSTLLATAGLELNVNTGLRLGSDGTLGLSAELGVGLDHLGARMQSLSDILALFESSAAGVDEPIEFETAHPIGEEPGHARHELPPVIGVIGNLRSEHLMAMEFAGL